MVVTSKCLGFTSKDLVRSLLIGVMPNVWGNIIWELIELAFLGPFLLSKIILVKIRVSCKVDYMLNRSFSKCD